MIDTGFRVQLMLLQPFARSDHCTSKTSQIPGSDSVTPVVKRAVRSSFCLKIRELLILNLLAERFEKHKAGFERYSSSSFCSDH